MNSSVQSTLIGHLLCGRRCSQPWGAAVSKTDQHPCGADIAVGEMPTIINDEHLNDETVNAMRRSAGGDGCSFKQVIREASLRR